MDIVIMTKITYILPFAFEPIYNECLNTIKQPLRNEIITIDNANYPNLGVAESWNRGIDYMKKTSSDWLVVISAAVRFGEMGGLDIVKQLEQYPLADVIHFAESHVEPQAFIRGESLGYHEGNLQWHLTAINRRVIDKVGYFDPNFYPMYFEDIDYDIRVNKAFDNPIWLILPIDVHRGELGHTLKNTDIKAPSEPLIAYFATKWGRHPSAKQLGEYDTPFNDKNNSLAYFPPAQGRLWNE